MGQARHFYRQKRAQASGARNTNKRMFVDPDRSAPSHPTKMSLGGRVQDHHSRWSAAKQGRRLRRTGTESLFEFIAPCRQRPTSLDVISDH